MLEELAIRFAVVRGESMPSPARKGMYIFCGDHGVTEEEISPYPSSVTREMMRNFVDGGAAISVLCRRHAITPSIVNTGVNCDPMDGTLHFSLGRGTGNIARGPAMTVDQARRALGVGGEMAQDAALRFDMAGLGEMGIGNTTVAAALLSAFTGADAAQTTGPGAGATGSMLDRKIDVVRRAIELHRPDPADGLGILAALGGFEIGAIAGFLLEARNLHLPVFLDGFPCCAGALIARAIRPDVLENAFFSHLSAEPGHRLMLEALEGEPILALRMRLGEGTAAALAMNLMDSAVRLYREMATFDEAGVRGAAEPDPGGQG